MAEVAAPARAASADWRRCPACEAFVYHKRLKRNLHVCPECNHHFRLRLRDRVSQLLDEGASRSSATSSRSTRSRSRTPSRIPTGSPPRRR